jgi:putative ABC transport system permease protein
MDTLLNDIRYTLRSWRRSPGFIAVAALTLALGIGANATMFSVINATVLRPLPFPGAERLMTLWKGRVKDSDNLNIVSWPNFRDYQERNRSFESLAIFDSGGRGYNLTSNGEPEQVLGLRVTASFFTVLGVQPMIGRTFLAAEETPGNDRVVVLTYGLWARRYGADRSIVGRTIDIDGEARTVIGVMPERFAFQFWSGPRQLFVPTGWTEGDNERGSNSFLCIGRLKPGVTADAARAEMDTIGRSLAEAHPKENIGTTVRVIPMSEYGVSRLRSPLFTLLGIVGFVLLIACVNVANLTLARAAARQRELAIRCALGAGRGRIARQLLTESVLLGLLGGVAGLILAVWAAKALLPVLPGNLSRMPGRPLTSIDLDVSVLAFTTAAAVLSGVLFGLAPAVAAFRTNLNDPLKDQARGSTGGRSRLRYGLVASEVALTLVVLAGAGVLILSMARLLGVNPGIDTKNVLAMTMSMPQEKLFYGPPDNLLFCEQLEREVRAVPGALSVSAIAHLPLGGGGAGRGLTVEGEADPGPGNQRGSAYSVACPNFLGTMGIPLVAGRDFAFTDTVSSPGVVIVNETLAKRFWPKASAVGKRFKIGQYSDNAPWLTVVGVMKDIRFGGLDEQPSSWFWRPYSQAGWPMISVVTKTAPAPSTLIAPIKQAIARVEPNQPVSGVLTMDDVASLSVSSRRFPMFLLSGFALLALLLAAVGIAGVVGYSVVQRTQEIGVRMALGAQPRDVLRLVLGHSLAWTLGGLVFGVIAAVGVLRLLGSMLYEVKPADPYVLGVASALLLLVAFGASYLPARRATRIDSMSALRGE